MHVEAVAADVMAGKSLDCLAGAQVPQAHGRVPTSREEQVPFLPAAKGLEAK